MIFLDIPAMYNYSNVNTLYQQALDIGVHGTHTRLLGEPPNALL